VIYKMLLPSLPTVETPPFAMLTAANRLGAPLHDRTPIILSPEDEATCVNLEASPAQAQACRKPFPAHLLRLTPVSPKLTTPASNPPDLLQRVPHE
jgi:putative SOS response-associated peptidase YedK